MSTTQYSCGQTQRRQAVLDDGTLNGIDYLEIGASQLELKLGLFKSVNGLQPGNFVLEGGVRITGLTVDQVQGQPGTTLALTVSAAGDFSTYTLRLVSAPGSSTPPAGFDPQLSAVDFSFKVGCPSDFDCKVVPSCPPASVTEPEIDYLAKDYSSFRRLMFDRLSVLMPDWRDRNPADAQVTLVELLAWAGDQLSYAQDAAATEAYLGTARRRVSLRRHARLLDYHIGEGCNARAFVALTVTAAANGKVLPGANPLLGVAGSRLATRLPELAPVEAELPAAAAERAVVFETLHDLQLFEAHNEIAFHTWSDSLCCLPAGATRATLRNDGDLALQPGDLLLLEEVSSPFTGLAADADPTHRHVVRLETVTLGPAVLDPLDGQLIAEVTWRREDALPFSLCISARIATGTDATQVVTVAIARGNIVLADHGRTVTDGVLVPAVVPPEGNYRPLLPLAAPTFAVPFDAAAVVVKDELTAAILSVEPAASALRFVAADAVPAVRLATSDETWLPQRDLLASDRFAAEFVVETERDGTAQLRFGDDQLGKRPESGTQFGLVMRVGSGTAGNLGAEALRHVFAPKLLLPPGSVTKVRNPLPAAGGTAPESLDQVRQFAPQAFRRQERAVTEADWVEVAKRYPGGDVHRAAARFRWTGSWYTVFITVDRAGGLPASDPVFKEALREHLERYRLAGYDLEIGDPIYVALDLLLVVCVKPGYFRSNVLAALRLAFSTQRLADGTLGFFHPDELTFGQPLYLSRVCETAMRVDGVGSVQLERFQRWGKLPNHELDNGVLTAAPLEILRLDNDPNFPENGKLEFELHGGL